VMPVLPRRSACLRCVFPQPPAAGDLPTCETAGVFGPAVAVVGAQQATLAVRVLIDQLSPADVALLSFDSWSGRFHSTPLAEARREDCPACATRRFDFLDAPAPPPSAAVMPCSCASAPPATAACLIALKPDSRRRRTI
jgi:adenylyltransferase/sulfurtransferase